MKSKDMKGNCVYTILVNDVVEEQLVTVIESTI